MKPLRACFIGYFWRRFRCCKVTFKRTKCTTVFPSGDEGFIFKQIRYLFSAMVLIILITGLLIELGYAAAVEKPKSLIWWRIFLGGLATFFYIGYPIDTIINLYCFMIGFYWTFFDGLYNVIHGNNWFYIGTTKNWDLFWGQHVGLAALAQFLKWLGVLSGIGLWL